MPALSIDIHPITPQTNRIIRVADALREGAVLLYPTDTGFALGCDLSNKEAISRVRSIRSLPDHKPLTFLCDSLTNIAEFAKVSNTAYRLIKRLIPGPYTFILPASKAVPRFAQDPKRKTTGIRVPDREICRALLKELGNPIISISARAGGDGDEYEIEEFIDRLAPRVDVIIRSQEYYFTGESTVIDMTTDDFTIRREGAGIDEALKFIGMAV